MLRPSTLATPLSLALPLLAGEPLDTAAWRIQFNSDARRQSARSTGEEIFVVLNGAVTATFADREETAEAGGALIVPANEEFSLVAKGDGGGGLRAAGRRQGSVRWRLLHPALGGVGPG